MLPAPSDAKTNQLIPVARGESLDRAILDLVGEIASYQPEGKLVIFEGGGDVEFDVGMTLALFPRLASTANTVSGTNRTRVRELHRLLEKAKAKGALRLTVFSIVDRDSEKPKKRSPSRELTWDRYHIENYLLEPEFIRRALDDALGGKNRLTSDAKVSAALREAATQAMDGILLRRLNDWANLQLINCIKTGAEANSQRMAQTLHKSVVGSRERLDAIVQKLDLPVIEDKLAEFRRELDRDLRSGSWRTNWPGREILGRFTDRHGGGVSSDVIRNLIVPRMERSGFEPAGMKRVVDAILAAKPKARRDRRRASVAQRPGSVAKGPH